ncbi:MAG: carbamoyltransferase [Acidobacteriia bacterium]|nr:carbamoyltransferase [Terriglobia bacterium]
MHILGLNAWHGDSSAARFTDGQLAFAIEEERLNRIKHWAGFPALAAEACLAGVDRSAVSHVAIGRNTRANLLRKLLYVATTPAAFSMALKRLRNAARVASLPSLLADLQLAHAQVHFVEHHRAHLASAFFASPFDEAAVVSLDGFGDFSSAMWGVGRGNRIDVRGAVRFPHSLGIFYSAFTQILGFPKYGDEYKMMGLAAFGKPIYTDKVRQVIHLNSDRIRLDLRYFVHHAAGTEMSWEGGEPVVGALYSGLMSAQFGPVRAPEEDLTPRHADLAASVQVIFEEIYFGYLRFVAKATGMRKVCLAGGVALNCAANGRIFSETPFSDVFIQPASHDAGISIGAALHVAHEELGQPRSFVMRHACWGPDYSDAAVQQALDAAGIVYTSHSEEDLLAQTAEAIASGLVVGWFQGRMEFGPRALGCRSILADPRRADMKDILNIRIKRREPFRPFCPSITAEDTGKYFELDYPSPFMVQAYSIRPEMRSKLPAVTHEDGTGRLQTVEKDTNPRYWGLLRAFEKLSGLPILINTSFNENEPIVNTPLQAIDCFLRTRMDMLVIGSFIARRQDNKRAGSHEPHGAPV